MDSTKQNARTQPATATIELSCITPTKKGTFAVVFSDDKCTWRVTAKPRDLQTFGAFQRCVAAKLGLWVNHPSQHLHPSRRTWDWQTAVRLAFQRGDLR